MTRSHTQQRQYSEFCKFAKLNGCVFCKNSLQKKNWTYKGKNKLINEMVDDSFRYFYIIKNAFPYTQWDNCKVQEHYLVISKDHLKSLEEMRIPQLAEWKEIERLYSIDGWNVYHRSPYSQVRTVEHFHAHLFKELRKLTVKDKVLDFINIWQ